MDGLTVLSEKRRVLELLLSHDACKLGEDLAEVQDIDAGLVVADQHGWPRLLEVLRTLNLKLEASEVAGDEMERTRDEPVDVEPRLFRERHGQRDEHAPDGADTEREDIEEHVEVEASAAGARREQRQD